MIPEAEGSLVSDAGQRVVRVTEIGEFLRHHSCERRFKLEVPRRQMARELPFAERLFNALDPVLQDIGRERENQWEQSLQRAGILDLTRNRERGSGQHANWENSVTALAGVNVGQPAYGREIEVGATVGAWRVEGRIDFVVLTWSDGKPRLRLIECKASRRDRAYHRIQVALYQLIVRELLADTPVSVGGQAIGPDQLECVVARIDETTNQPQSIIDLEPLILDMETDDLQRLLAASGTLDRIAGAELGDLPYQLDSKCDGCVFSVHCLPESARQRRLELLGIEPATVRLLRSAGINTIDALAELDLASESAQRVRGDPSFSRSLERLRIQARARRHTLPGGDADPDAYEAMAIPHTGQGQLPPHEIGGQHLVRIYLSVNYDYAENRVGALAAHVTNSDYQIHTALLQNEDGTWRPDPVVRERRETEQRDEDGRPVFAERPLGESEVIRFKTSEWSGDYNQDTAAERELIQGFLHDLVDQIAEVACADAAPIHFYVWSRSEMTQLVEACSRSSSRLLGALRELLGCRESLEQLIFSCVQEEIDNRYALGWTGRGLSVASSLQWYGRRFHWRRVIAGQEVSLDHEFTQDIFDFKTQLDLREDGNWARRSEELVRRHRFEIRSRFYDSLTPPYWRACWGTLPDPDAADRAHNVAAALRRYQRAGRPLLLREYLRARTHALRWMEEGVRFKNGELVKPSLSIEELRRFRLGVDDAAQAAIDFLRLDQHVKTTKWISDHLRPVADRVALGRTVPVRDVVSDGQSLTAMLAVDEYGVSLGSLEARCSFAEGSWVRLSPHSGDPQQGQTVGQLTRAGRTCRIASINWQAGRVVLEPIWQRIPDRYRLLSIGAGNPGHVFAFATIDESVSDFVAGKVDERLRTTAGAYVYRWLDPEEPEIPTQLQLPEARVEELREAVRSLSLPPRRLPPTVDQLSAVIDGLRTRVQLIPGPPGTGKTTTSALAALTRITACRQVGDTVLVAAHTHTAVNRLLLKMDEILPAFTEQLSARGLSVPFVRLVKVHSSIVNPDEMPGGTVADFPSSSCAQRVNRMRQDAVLVIGGTTSALLRMAAELSQRKPFARHAEGFQVPLLVVDEASMMVFPHFLALASLVTEEGEIMLAGDHRQLAPIVAHDWEREDRPPAVLYKPFASAYEAIQRIMARPGVTRTAVLRSPLRYSFRLPPEVLELIARIYRLDDIELTGEPRPLAPAGATVPPWGVAWDGASGLYLIAHTERESRQANSLELQIIEQLLEASGRQPDGSIAIVTPHRAQRSLLRTRLQRFHGPVDVIDTVERLQGDERPAVIVSATASDPSAISRSVEFILDLNRANVAFSRTRDRLIVVCSETLLDHMPVEVEHYESAMLWKALRSLCTEQLAQATLGVHQVRILTMPPQQTRALADEGRSTGTGGEDA